MGLAWWQSVAWLMPDPGAVAKQLNVTALQFVAMWQLEYPIIAMATSILLIDMARCWVHRLLHRVNFLWRLHAIHHSDTDVDATTGFRHHPLEYLATIAIMMPLYILLEIPAASIVVYGVLAASITPFSHANTGLPDGVERVVNKIFITNQLHALHHSAELGESNSNFGTVFAFWDRIFATRIEPTLERFSCVPFSVQRISAETAASLPKVLMQPFRFGAIGGQPAVAVVRRGDDRI